MASAGYRNTHPIVLASLRAIERASDTRLDPLKRHDLRQSGGEEHRGRKTQGAQSSELIVEPMKTCQDAMRAMIDAHDRLFGAGTGEAFFMRPYLDVLPATVNRLIDRGSE
jgi:hypothetical protein